MVTGTNGVWYNSHAQNLRLLEKEREFLRQRQEEIRKQQAMDLQIDPFLSGLTQDHTRQESSDSGLSLSSNNVSLPHSGDFLGNLDENMDCISGEFSFLYSFFNLALRTT